MHATARRSTPGSATPRRGVTYLALLLAIALVAGVLAASAQVWSTVQRREREAQLLWAGEQYRRALAAYAASGDGRYPQRLEDLLVDPRSPVPRRHLRRLYDDPILRSPDWALLRDAQGGIVGLHSRSEALPLKTGRFARHHADFAGAKRYADWVFAAAPHLLRRQPAAPGEAPVAPPRATPSPAATRPATTVPLQAELPPPSTDTGDDSSEADTTGDRDGR